LCADSQVTTWTHRLPLSPVKPSPTQPPFCTCATVARGEARIATGKRQATRETSIACVHNRVAVRLARALSARRQRRRVGVGQRCPVAGHGWAMHKHTKAIKQPNEVSDGACVIVRRLASHNLDTSSATKPSDSQVTTWTHRLPLSPVKSSPTQPPFCTCATVARGEARIATGKRQATRETSIACVHNRVAVGLARALSARRQRRRVGVDQRCPVAGHA
jgi:hypothetical protein